MNVQILPILCLTLSISSFCLSYDKIRYAPIVNLEQYGQVRGLIQSVPMISKWPDSHKDVYFYQGIRYGKSKRFERSEKADKWTGVYDATHYREACPQPDNEWQPNANISEDCLYLNVWTSTEFSKSKKSVMVWIHGGAFVTGTIFYDVYNGGMIVANEDVIVVSIAYRLGPFGFLYTGDSEHDAKGNQGLHDQILALQWVKENIHHFGGDPNHVTIFGESAGSMSVSALILSPLAHGLFHRAIMQSGAANPDLGCISKSEILSKSFELAKIMNCSNEQKNMTAILQCFRNKPMEEFWKSFSPRFSNEYMMSPIYGDDLMPLNCTEALKTGKDVNRVDLMYGINRDEGTPFLPIFYPNDTMNVEQCQQVIRDFLNGKPYTEEVVQFYTKHLNDSYSNPEEIKLAATRVIGDFSLVCPTVIFGKEMIKHLEDKNIYSYRLMAPTVSMSGHNWLGVTHGQDLIYVFGGPFRTPKIKFTINERHLSHDMMKAWARFAKHGHPGPIGQKHIKWTASKPGSVQFMYLDSQDYHLVQGSFHHTCDKFWRPKIFV